MKAAKRGLGVGLCLAAVVLVPAQGFAQHRRVHPPPGSSAADAAAPATDATPPAATPEEDAATRARALFAEGVSLAGEGHYADATARFRQALVLRDAPTIRYNLASTLFEQHQYTEAHEIASALLAQADLPESVRAPTAALELSIGAASGFVTFVLPEGVSGDVQLDDTPVGNLAQATAVAPGRHTARVVSAGETLASATFELGSGVRRTVELEVAASAPVDSGSRAITEEWWFWTAIGVGVVVIGVVIGVAIGVADHDAHAPIPGNFSPGIISW